MFVTDIGIREGRERCLEELIWPSGHMHSVKGVSSTGFLYFFDGISEVRRTQGSDVPVDGCRCARTVGTPGTSLRAEAGKPVATIE